MEQLKRGDILLGHINRIVLFHKSNNRYKDDPCSFGTAITIPGYETTGEYFEFWHLNDNTLLGRSIILNHINNIERSWI